MERVISTAVKTRFAVERFEYLLITNRNEKAAKLLSLFESVHGQKIDELDSKILNDPRYKVTEADYKQQYTRKMLNLYSFNTDYSRIHLHVDELAKAGFINVERTFSGNVATGYSILFNSYAVQTAVNDALQDYTIVLPSGKAHFDQKKYFEWYYQKSVNDADLMPDLMPILANTPPCETALPPVQYCTTPPCETALPPVQDCTTIKHFKSNILLSSTENENFSKISVFEEEKEGFLFEKTNETPILEKIENSPEISKNEYRRQWGADCSHIVEGLKEFYGGVGNEAYKNTVVYYFERFSKFQSKDESELSLILEKYILKFSSNFIKKKTEDFYDAHNQKAIFSTYASLLELHTAFLGAFSWLSSAIETDEKASQKADNKKNYQQNAPKNPTVSVVRQQLTTDEDYKKVDKFEAKNRKVAKT